jgi:hypothetical protein
MQTWSQAGRSHLAVGLSALALAGLVHAAPPPNPPPGPSITINDTVATESSCTGVNAVFTVQLSRQSTQVVSVQFATANGSASAPGDYQNTSGTLTFQARERTKTILVPILSDQVTEGTETFVLNLSAPMNGTISDGQGVGRILNDECDDADSCTTDSCNPVTLACQNIEVSCDDNNVCTSDTCNPSGGCQHQAVDLGSTTCGTGACERTVSVCVGGVPQTCTPGTPTAEVCNGLDDDCNGSVDGAGSEASCQFANATATCSGGACAIAACTAGFGDCNGSPADGCENRLDTATDCGSCGTACGANGTCTGPLGSAVCACNPGYEGDGLTCTDIDDCLANNGGCDPNATCTNQVGAPRICACNPGYEGDGLTCTDIDDCLANNGGCDPNATCTNQVGAPRICACNPGYTGDGVTCADINECFASPCGANATCSNTVGSFNCTCIPGYGDCDGDTLNGCETDLTTTTNCGACGNDCNFGFDACHHSSCTGGACTPVIETSRCLAPGETDPISSGFCAFAESPCPSAVDSDGDGLRDTWEENQAIDYDCNGYYDSNDPRLPKSNKFVKDVYLKIDYMAGSIYVYEGVDDTGCFLTAFTEPFGHRPQQDSIDLVVSAFAGAHLQDQDPQRCGKTGDEICPDGFSCVDYVCLPTCNSDSDCAPSCNAACAAAGGARCVPKDDGSGNVCRLWRLHVDDLPAIGVEHHDIVAFGEISDECGQVGYPGCDPFFDPHCRVGDKANLFTYKASRFDPKEASFKHYMLFGHANTCIEGCGFCPVDSNGRPPESGTSGVSEIRGNDSIVSLGLLQVTLSGDRGKLIAAEAGMILHELGHNLGLDHGGPYPSPGSDVLKVNYLSSMNPLYQHTGIPFTNAIGSNIVAGARPDFSRQAFDLVLNEAVLNEGDGIGVFDPLKPISNALITYFCPDTPAFPCPPDPCTGEPPATCLHYGSGALGTPIDWNCSGSIDTGTVIADINGNGSTAESHNAQASDDWTRLVYKFQCQTTYANGGLLQTGPPASPDATVGPCVTIDAEISAGDPEASSTEVPVFPILLW